MNLLDHPLISERYFFPRADSLDEPFRVETNGIELLCHRTAGNPMLVHFHGNGEVVSDWVLRSPEPFQPHSGRVLAGLPGKARFDSLAVMANGNIAVATLTTGYITEFSPAGDLVREVQMPDVYPTNICFGGADMRTAYITLSDSGRLGMMQWPEPGLKLNFG